MNQYRLAALPPDVRKVYDLPLGLILFGGYALTFNATPGRSPTKPSTSEGRRPSAHQAAEPQKIIEVMR